MKTIYQGNKVTIRPISLRDTDNLVRWRNNPNVLRNFIDQDHITPESHEAWLEKYVFTGAVHQFIICENETGKDIGSVFIKDIDTKHLHGEYGIFIGEDNSRGKGFGTEACRLLCEFAFEQLGLKRIYLRVLASNTGAVRSYKKIGFVEEGVLRKHVNVNNDWCDLILMGLLKEEFNYDR